MIRPPALERSRFAVLALAALALLGASVGEESAGAAAGGKVVVVGAWTYARQPGDAFPKAGEKLVGVELRFEGVPDGFDLDDVELAEAGSGATFESGPDIAFLDAAGRFASWAEAPDPERLHVLLIYAVPERVASVRISHWGEALGGAALGLKSGGPELPPGFTAAAPAPALGSGLAALAWLAGCWSYQGAEPGSGEQWMAPAAGSMLGVSRTVRGGRTAEHEFLEIRETEPGRLAYIAHPSGQAGATFPLVRLEAAGAIFENPAHDFPQRVIYRLDGAVLRARIEGTRAGKVEGVDFPMERVPCPGALPAPAEGDR